jgi:hypothetical protein
MSTKAAKSRMAQLAQELGSQKEDIKFPKAERGKKISAGIPGRGQRGDFYKLTATLPADLYQRVLDETARRKLAKEPGADFSSLIREALGQFFSGRATQGDSTS